MTQDYIKGIIKEILTEEARITDVSSAIRQRKEVKIEYYDNDEPKGKGERIIQPVAYGLSKAGNMVLRAFQPYGDTKTKIPHWKLFRLDKIRNWKTLWKRTFEEPPGFFNSEGEFNPNGDKTMSNVYLVANFERSRQFKRGERGQGLQDYNKNRQQIAAEKSPLYKLNQNINNSIKDKDVMDRINKYPSTNAKEYVKGNDVYVNDMSKVKNDNNDMQPQTMGAINKGDIENQSIVKNNKNNIDIDNIGAVEKE